MSFRIGQGYDAHRLAEGRKLILGGAEIPHTHGLLGHSDADVLAHAVIDALLGAAALGDIGMHFPDTDGRYRNADSLALLRQVRALTKGRVINADCTVIAQAPKLGQYREIMRRNLAEALETEMSAVNVKFTTEEGMGFTGAREGIAAAAVLLLSTT